jgi:hypothetical protein
MKVFYTPTPGESGGGQTALHRQVGRDCAEFLRGAPGVREICEEKTRHTRHYLDRLGKIPRLPTTRARVLPVVGVWSCLVDLSRP